MRWIARCQCVVTHRPEYIDRIKKHMRPLVEHIRFSMLPLPILNTLANEMLVPTRYLTEVRP